MLHALAGGIEGGRCSGRHSGKHPLRRDQLKGQMHGSVAHPGGSPVAATGRGLRFLLALIDILQIQKCWVTGSILSNAMSFEV